MGQNPPLNEAGLETLTKKCKQGEAVDSFASVFGCIQPSRDIPFEKEDLLLFLGVCRPSSLRSFKNIITTKECRGHQKLQAFFYPILGSVIPIVEIYKIRESRVNCQEFMTQIPVKVVDYWGKRNTDPQVALECYTNLLKDLLKVFVSPHTSFHDMAEVLECLNDNLKPLFEKDDYQPVLKDLMVKLQSREKMVAVKEWCTWLGFFYQAWYDSDAESNIKWQLELTECHYIFCLCIMHATILKWKEKSSFWSFCELL
ncbi:hypothetical protein Ciccas_008456 [Cichlidogyrus casuarinus]|uniref:Uncharacterized protein n=1 Tax=Cichlidogyrus casuarinus TaxID=1844966 RepID=A0ABD2PZX4_9PLAT